MTPKAPAVSVKLKELSDILELVTGKTLEQFTDDVVSGKPEAQMIAEISANIRRKNEDPLKKACEELAADMGVKLEDLKR